MLAAARRKRGVTQVFFALDDLFKPPLECALGAQRLPDRKKRDEHRECRQQDDDVLELHPRG